MNRHIDDVIILGSGMSILDLTEDQISHINSCKIVVALNKFMSYYKKSKILPTHVFYMETDLSGMIHLHHLLRVCNEARVTNLTFMLHKHHKKNIYMNTWQWLFVLINAIPRVFFYLLSFSDYNTLAIRIKNAITFSKVSKSNKLIFGDRTNWLEGGAWSDDLKKPFFHYVTSLSSVLNYCTIISPKCDIYLVGNDFNSPQYFFQKEYENEQKRYIDPAVREMAILGNHFSVHSSSELTNGKTIFDKLPFILQKLEECGNHIFSLNEQSVLTKKGFIPYKDFNYL